MNEGGHRPVRQRRGRGRVLCGTVLALVLAGAGPASSMPAQSAGTITTAKSVAVIASYAPSMGALKLAVTSGASVAELRNDLAQSQSQFLDFGLIGSSLTAIPCADDEIAGQDPLGDDPPVSPNDLPQPLRVDNRQGEASDEVSEASTPGGLVTGGRSQVRATPQPFAEAISTTSRVALGELAINGGRATAAIEVVDGGAAHLARAEVVADVGIPGVLRLSGLQWDALHRTGTDPEATGSFSFGSVEILGQAMPVDGVPAEDVVEAINAVVGPLGLTIGSPTVQHVTDPVDFVRVTPLRLRFGESPLGALVFSPVLGATQQLRDELAVLLHEANCRTASGLTVFEIALGQITGIGSTVVDVGGVEATSASAALTNPFGDGSLLPPTLDLPPTDLDPVPLPAPGARTSAPAPGTVAAPAPGITESPPLAAQPVGSFERVCQSVHPFRWPSCSSGAAPLVGLVAVAATAGIGFLDWRHQRRRSTAAAAVGDAS